MKIFRRTIYLIYYLRESDFKQLRKFCLYASKNTGRSQAGIYADMLLSVYRYNVSLKDYFCFRFFELDRQEREKWAGTGYLYEYQLKMNPKESRDLLEDKIRFLHHFRKFVKRSFYSIREISESTQKAEELLNNRSGKLVLKGSHGQVGAEVEVVSSSQFSPSSLTDYMKRKKYDLAEEYVVQHPQLMELSPSGLNTVRVFTQLEKGKVNILGARLRVSVNSPVDNMAAGNLAAPVDEHSGMISGPAVYSDITKEEKSQHPVTKKELPGFVVPHWEKVITLACDAALHTPENRSVGWDIAITPEGPELIEGNHNWCKLLWQMPVKKGLKSELDKYN